MNKSATHQPILSKGADGNVVQAGSVSDFTRHESVLHQDTQARADAVCALFEVHGLSIKKSPTLAKLYDDTSFRTKARAEKNVDAVTYSHLFSATLMERIASGVLMLTGHPNAKKYLLDLLMGSMDLLSRKSSKAKNIFWELELCQMLREVGLIVDLSEPDLTMNFEGKTVGIACKKLYSEANVSKVISNAIGQIERTSDFGIVAINLDDLLPDGKVMRARTAAIAASALAGRVEQFLNEQERCLRKYLEPGRAMTALISCGALAVVADGPPDILNVRQCFAWRIPGNPSPSDAHMQRFIDAFEKSYGAES